MIARRRRPSCIDLRELLNISPPRCMLVDAATGDDLREALASEVAHVMRSASFSGTAMLALGDGRGDRAVTLRRVDTPHRRGTP